MSGALTPLHDRSDGRRGEKLSWASALAAFAVMFVLLLAGAANVLAAPAYPQLTGQIVDQAGLLTAEDRAAILSELQALEGTSTDQVAVVTVKSLEGYAIEDYSIGLARQWQIGQKDKDNGIVLLVAPNERKVRIEVGRRLEPILSDTLSSLVINNSILPRFRRGDFSGGIRAGVHDIKDILLGDAEAVKERSQVRKPQNDLEHLLPLVLFFGIFALVIFLSVRQQRRMEAGMTPDQLRRYRRQQRRGGGVIIIPGGSSDWGGGWSGGGGGGGWSGGGGDFGGGGSSGSW